MAPDLSRPRRHLRCGGARDSSVIAALWRFRIYRRFHFGLGPCIRQRNELQALDILNVHNTVFSELISRARTQLLAQDRRSAPPRLETPSLRSMTTCKQPSRERHCQTAAARRQTCPHQSTSTRFFSEKRPRSRARAPVERCHVLRWILGVGCRALIDDARLLPTWVGVRHPLPNRTREAPSTTTSRHGGPRHPRNFFTGDPLVFPLQSSIVARSTPGPHSQRMRCIACTAYSAVLGRRHYVSASGCG